MHVGAETRQGLGIIWERDRFVGQTLCVEHADFECRLIEDNGVALLVFGSGVGSCSIPATYL